MPNLTYRDVLVARAHIGHIQTMADMARQLGYPYYLWNDRIYEVTRAASRDTGLTVSDIQAELHESATSSVRPAGMDSAMPATSSASTPTKAEFMLTLFDDANTKKKLTMLTPLETMFDDERNVLPPEYFYFSDEVKPGSSIRVIFELLDEPTPKKDDSC